MIKPIVLLTTLSFLMAQGTAQTPPDAAVSRIARQIASTYGAPQILVEEFLVAAIRLEADKGIPAAALTAIAILESAGLTSFLFAETNNPFGIKGRKPFKGPVYIMWHEGEDTPFRRYANMHDATRGFEAFLRERRWFHDALKCPQGDNECFITALMANPAKREPGFSADPLWGDKVRKLIGRFELGALASSPSSDPSR